jgi:Undecaprenyl-phosphate glucose phosphotransferase
VRLVPDYLGLQLLAKDISEVAGITVMNFSSSQLSSRFNRFIKELMDRVIASFILLMISPLMMLIALGVKLSSPGPILFKQLRHGVNNKPIWIYKFRTMKIHEEHPGKVIQAKRDDERVTAFGAFLRRTSLDELPQFINVLQGRMSIVGPRPHAVEHNEFYKNQMDFYTQRHMVKPGITGWAQISGWRGETDCLEKMQKRVEHDLYYIEHWSPWLDLKIIMLTALRMFTDKNAY